VRCSRKRVREGFKLSSKLNISPSHHGEIRLAVFEVSAKIIVSARSKEEAEKLVDSKLLRLESDVILKTERTEIRELPQ
jgi:hypothetical protein